MGTAAGLRALHELRFRGRIVLASSMVVYGEGRYRCADHGDVRPGARTAADLDAGRFDPPCPRCGAPLAWAPTGEDAPPDPRNVYAATKLHQEHLCAVFGREHGVPVTALRYHNVYGPRMPRDTPYAGVASIFRSAVARGEPPRCSRTVVRPATSSTCVDVARANVAALTCAEPVRRPAQRGVGPPADGARPGPGAVRGSGLGPGRGRRPARRRPPHRRQPRAGRRPRSGSGRSSRSARSPRRDGLRPGAGAR